MTSHKLSADITALIDFYESIRIVFCKGNDAKEVSRSLATVVAMASRIAELEKALEPFADFALAFDPEELRRTGKSPDKYYLEDEGVFSTRGVYGTLSYQQLRISDVRHARKVMSGSEATLTFERLDRVPARVLPKIKRGVSQDDRTK